MITIAVSSMFIHNIVFFIFITYSRQFTGLAFFNVHSSLQSFCFKEKPEKPEKARRDSHVPRRGGCFPKPVLLGSNSSLQIGD